MRGFCASADADGYPSRKGMSALQHRRVARTCTRRSLFLHRHVYMCQSADLYLDADPSAPPTSISGIFGTALEERFTFC